MRDDMGAILRFSGDSLPERNGDMIPSLPMKEFNVGVPSLELFIKECYGHDYPIYEVNDFVLVIAGQMNDLSIRRVDLFINTGVVHTSLSDVLNDLCSRGIIPVGTYNIHVT
ncbi:MAG: hypothetical protein KY428_10430 [Bacteroidetes bacterium]|nr:hypothetical protein [Bacteroidota bacterium]